VCAFARSLPASADARFSVDDVAPHCPRTGALVGSLRAVGEVIGYEEVVRLRRRRAAHAVVEACRRILADSVALAREELVTAPPRERMVRMTRLRKLEELEAYATAHG